MQIDSKQRPEGRGGTHWASRGWEGVKIEHCGMERKQSMCKSPGARASGTFRE